GAGGGGATATGFGLAGGGGGGSDFVVAGAANTHETSGVGTGDGHITLTFTLPGTTVGQVFTPSRSRPCQSPMVSSPRGAFRPTRPRLYRPRTSSSVAAALRL